MKIRPNILIDVDKDQILAIGILQGNFRPAKRTEILEDINGVIDRALATYFTEVKAAVDKLSDF